MQSFQLTQKNFDLVLQNMINAYALQKVITDKQGEPVDFIIMEVNLAFEKIVGLKRNEIIGKSISEVLARSENETFDWINVYEEVTRSGECLSFENYNQKLNKLFLINAYIPEEGYLVAIFEDISYKKLEEEKTSKYEYYLSKAQELGKIGTWEFDIRTNLFIWTDALYTICGLPIGSNVDLDLFMSIIHPEDRDYVLTKQKATLTENKPFDVEHRLLVGDQIKWVRAKAGVEFDENGNKIKVLGYIQDITERKHAEELLKASEKKHRTILKTSNDGIWLVDNKGYLVEVNESYCRLSGYTEAELLKMHISDIEALKDSFLIRKRMQKIIKEGGERFETKHVRKDGSFVDVEVSVQLQDIEGERFVCFIHDITEAKLKEKQLLKEKEKAEKANSAKSTFLANMSHEIRTPLNSILGFSEFLMDKRVEADEKKYLEIIYNSGSSLLSLINDILDLSKVESGTLELEHRPVSIKQVIKEVDDLFRHKINNKGLDFYVNVNDNIPRALLLDETRIKQVLINLLGNAVKFTNSGHIGLRVTPQKNSKHPDSILNLLFEIEDTGKGIPKDQFESIFQTFTQVKGQKTSEYGGTGLGLSITRKLVDLMNGSITVESELEKGSKFTICIKEVEITSDEPKSTRPRINTKSIRFAHAKLLICDDIKYNRDLVKGFLEDHDFQIIEASNGKEALELIREQNPDVILMDIKMPVMDGYELIEILNKDKKFSKTPIITLTASAMKEDAEVISQLCDDYLKKPVSKSDLYQSLMSFIPYKTKNNR